MYEINGEVVYTIEEVSEFLNVRPGIIRQTLLDNKIFSKFTEDPGDMVLYGKIIVDPFYKSRNIEVCDIYFIEKFFIDDEGIERFILLYRKPAIKFISELIKDREEVISNAKKEFRRYHENDIQ